MLERIGGEVARATSIVRYSPGSRFPRHVHELGEEFLVLSGVFSDEHGDHPAGTYVRNPPGSAHAPHSADGCVIFVNLRQMDAQDRHAVVETPVNRAWRADGVAGVDCAKLHADAREEVMLLRLAPGSRLPERATPGGEELLVVEGEMIPDDGSPALRQWGWRRDPSPRQPALTTTTGALLWVKRTHL